MRSAFGAVVRWLGIALALSGCAPPPPVRLATAMSLVGPGAMTDVLNRFSTRTGNAVEILSVGSAAALQLLDRGDVDAAIVESPTDAQASVVGHPKRQRIPLWRLRLVLLGPAGDPAHVRGKGLTAGLAAIAASRQPFVSIGDRSGLHRREQELWVGAGSPPKGLWYQEAGIGLRGALHLATQRHAYIICDQASAVHEPAASGYPALVTGLEAQALDVDLVYDPDAGPGGGRAQVLPDLIAALVTPRQMLPAGYLPRAGGGVAISRSVAPAVTGSQSRRSGPSSGRPGR
jgi:tungstate transport system substrate-binding protein